MSLIESQSDGAVAVLPSTLRLGAVHLAVADLDRSAAWYERSLGLLVHARKDGHAELGDGSESLVVLHENPAARPPGRHAGLYHYALLYPSREELARAVQRLAGTRTPIDGASDHRTHEAVYLPDADGNGIELAWDRPREQWPVDLGYAGGPAPLDFPSLLASVEGQPLSPHVGEGLRMGHLHLHVGDIDTALDFYRDLLGFEVQANLGSAAFVSAGGYHHHLGINVWNGRGAEGVAADTVGLRQWTIQLPTDTDVNDVRHRFAASGGATEPIAGGFGARDPWGTHVAFVSTAASGLHAMAVVETAKPLPYLRQLAKHFRHKLDVRFDDEQAVIPFAVGHAELRTDDAQLRIDAYAHTPADLARVKDIVGSHMERFGRRDGLAVIWTSPQRP